MTDRYVAASGGVTSGAGGIGAPWTLAYALAGAGGTIVGDDTVWLRGGTYAMGAVTPTVHGTNGHPVIIRQYPAEHAILEGTFSIDQPDTWFWGFEQRNVDDTTQNVMGFDVHGARVKLINVVARDNSGNGIGMWIDAPDSEAVGCIDLNNGWCGADGGPPPTPCTSFGHGFYIQNQTPATKILRDNVVFGGYGYGLHIYGAGAFLDNITAEGNVLLDNGHNTGVQTVVGGVPVTNFLFQDNFCYHATTNDYLGTVWIGRAGEQNADAIVRRNFIVGGQPCLRMYNWTSATVEDNVVESHLDSTCELDGVVAGNFTWGGNTWYGTASSAEWMWNTTTYTFAAWRTLTGLGSTDTYGGSGHAPARVHFRINPYETTRALLAIYNPTDAASVNVTPTGLLTSGDTYEVRHVFDLWGTPVASGTYTSGAIAVPMDAVAAPTPLGGGSRAATGPRVNAFIMVKTGSGSGAQTVTATALSLPLTVSSPTLALGNRTVAATATALTLTLPAPTVSTMTTYFVIPAAAGGSDAANGLTKGTAFATWAHAKSVMVAGDTITIVDDHRYPELCDPNAAVTVARSGDGAAPPIFSAADLATGWSITTPGTTTYIADTFDRANASGWGTADGGSDSDKTWDGGTTNFSIATNKGALLGTFTFHINAVGDSSTRDLDITVDVAGIATDANWTGPTVYARYASGNDHYAAYYDCQNSNLILRKIIGGVSTDHVTVNVGQHTAVTMRVQVFTVAGNVTHRAKCWTGSEPGSWTATWTDSTSPHLTGGIVLGGGNTSVATITFDNLAATTIPGPYTFTYQSSVTTDPGTVVLEDGVALTLVASAAAVEATAGTWFWAANLLYVHASDSSNVSSNGKVYEAGARNYAFDTATASVVINGIEFRGAKLIGIRGQAGATGLTVNNYRVRGCAEGIQVTGTTSVLNRGPVTGITNGYGIELLGAGSKCYHADIQSVVTTSALLRIGANNCILRNNMFLPADAQQITESIAAGVTGTDSDYNEFYRPIGLLQGAHQNVSYYATSGERTAALARMKGLGATIARDSVLVEFFSNGGAGVYDWARYDQVVLDYTSAGMIPLWTYYNRSPTWLNGTADPTFVPGNGDATDATFLTWCNNHETALRAWLTRYSAYVTYLEIGNEPNEQYFWSRVSGTPTFCTTANQYRVWFNQMAAAAKSIKSSIVIAAGVVTGIGASSGAYSSGRVFVQHLLDDSGGITNYDAISCHPYDSDAPDVDTAFQQNFSDLGLIIADLASRGLTAKRVWATEWGWSPANGATERGYLDTAMSYFSLRYPQVTISTYFLDEDTPNFTANGLFDNTGTAKTVAQTWAQRVQPLVDWKGTTQSFLVHQLANGIDAHSFIANPLLGVDFALAATSPARNAGVVVAGINDGAGGSTQYAEAAPDIGADEYVPGQLLQPIGDVTITGWTPTPSSPATCYDKLDEATVDDADYVTSPTAPADAEPLILTLTSAVAPIDPSLGGTVTIRLGRV